MATTVIRREAKDFKVSDPPLSVTDPDGLGKLYRRMLYHGDEQRIVTSPEEEADARDEGWRDHAQRFEVADAAPADDDAPRRGRARKVVA